MRYTDQEEYIFNGVARFLQNLWPMDLADFQKLSRHNNGQRSIWWPSQSVALINYALLQWVTAKNRKQKNSDIQTNESARYITKRLADKNFSQNFRKDESAIYIVQHPTDQEVKLYYFHRSCPTSSLNVFFINLLSLHL